MDHTQLAFKGLAGGRWFEFTLPMQFANIGSEVHRMIKWMDTDAERALLAYYRALELTDLTIADPKNKGRLREICRSREVLSDFFYDNEYNQTPEQVMRYYDQFASIARPGL